MRRGLHRLGLAALAGALALSCAGSPALAQYPSKPVRVVVPFAAGGTPDVVGRIISQQLAAQTGQAFVVENRPGADGVLGAQTVAEAPPDGYTASSRSAMHRPSSSRSSPRRPGRSPRSCARPASSRSDRCGAPDASSGAHDRRNQPATVLQFDASCSAPRSDSARMV
jgi:hypothetical protein